MKIIKINEFFFSSVNSYILKKYNVLTISLIVIFASDAHLVSYFNFLSTQEPKFSIADFF